MPNWRNPDEYPSPGSLSDVYWAWEFLRRNPDYREEWKGALRRWERSLSQEDRELRREQEQARREHPEKAEDRLWVLCEGPSGLKTYMVVLDPLSPHFILMSSTIQARVRRWGLAGYVNPDVDRPMCIFDGWTPSDHHEPLRIRPKTVMGNDSFHLFNPPKRVYFDLRFHEVAVPFNLRLPIDYQLKVVKAMLKGLQKSYKALGGKLQKPNRPRKLWPLYLRLLDGSADGATYEEMAEVVFPEEHRSADCDAVKKVDDTLQAARKMTQPSGYLKLLAP